MLPITFNSNIADKLKDREKLNKIKSTAASTAKSRPKSNNIMDVIEYIRQDVNLHLGQFKDQYQVITDFDVFSEYIRKSNEYGYIAIDTETTGLNPMVDQIVGLCLYFPGEPATYVPINHVDYYSDIRIPEQLTEAQVCEVLRELTAKIIYHNAPFDIRVIEHQVGIRLPVYWDTLPASQLIDEVESHGLKDLHSKYCNHGEVEKTFSELFGKIPFKYIPIDLAFLYAAHDAIDTFELCDFQKTILKPSENKYANDLYNLFRNIEIPMIDVVVDLEDIGVAVNVDYLKELQSKYHKNLETALQKCSEEIENNYKDKITKYNLSHINKPLEYPVNISSNAQLAILFYDVIGAKLQGSNSKSVDKTAMDEFKSKYPLAKYIEEYRAAQKITSTYVDNIFDIIHTDGRVHTGFKSNGATTGRMSSSQPLNLQNIPSKNEDIRKMFVGQTTYRDVELRSDNAYILERCEEVEMDDGSWKWAELVKPGDILASGEKVKAIKHKELRILIGIEV